jgi:type IV secretory pathway TraG/TraD family ATPase VirD4
MPKRSITKIDQLESNKLREPAAGYFEFRVVIFLCILMTSYIVWDGIIVFSNQIENYYALESFDIILTAATPWTTPRGIFTSDIALAIGYVVLLCVILKFMFGSSKPKVGETRIDAYAYSMGHGRAIAGLLESACQEKVKRLVSANSNAGNVKIPPGIRLGKLLYDHKTILYSDWEAEMLVIAGPRTGKTTGYVIPAILHAPGPCISTANKRDVVDSTRAILEQEGRKTWLFDPEKIASGEPSWYWNPIKSVRNLDDAKRIADCWRSTSGLNTSEGNAEFFNGGAATQLANYLFAAALDDLTLADIFKWCQDEKDDTPARILDKHGYNIVAEAVYGTIAITPETRSGIFAGLKKMVDFIIDDKLVQWIQCAGPDDTRPEFDPFDFALSRETLYLLSQKGARSTPITAALTAVTARAAYEISQEMGGRLPLPLLGVLDECANVCPWPELPEIYSYYGSCGIILISLFQNTNQGVMAFTENGFKSLFDNANTFVYLGGNKDDKFLPQLSTLIGQRDLLSHSVNDNKGFTSGETRNLRQEKIFTEQQLAEWPEFRALILSSQNRATIVETIPFFKDPDLMRKVQISNDIAKQQVRDSFNLEKLKSGIHHQLVEQTEFEVDANNLGQTQEILTDEQVRKLAEIAPDEYYLQQSDQLDENDADELAEHNREVQVEDYRRRELKSFADQIRSVAERRNNG